MLRKLALIAALGSAVWLSTAAAIGLGEIEVKSALNQRFVASIPLTAASAEEAEAVQVSLASVAEFQRAGLERSEYLSSLRFDVETAGGIPRIEVRSTQIAREPFINFLVEVRSGGSRLLREYTILLDPPAAAILPAPAPAPAASAPTRSSEFFETSEEAVRRRPPVSTPPDFTPAPVPAAVAPTAPAAPGGSSYGPVQARETFWSIATKLRTDPSLTMDQMLLAIYEANRGAFDGGINGLKVGAMLTVPSAEEIAATPPATAKARVNALRGGAAVTPRAKPRRPPTSVASPPSPAPEPTAAIEAPAVPASPSVAKPVAPPKVVAPPPPKVVAPPPPPPPKPVIAEPAPEPVAPVPAPAPEPAPEPAAAAPVEPVAPAATEPSPAVPEGTAPVSPEAVPPVAETPPPAEPTPEPAPAPLPVEEESGGLIEMLVPIIGALLVLGGLGYLVSMMLKKRREGGTAASASAPPPMPLPITPSLAKPLAGAAVAAGAAAVAKPVTPAKSAAANARSQLEQLSDTLGGEETESFGTRQLQTQQVPTRAEPSSDRLPSERAGDEESQFPAFDSTATQVLGAEEIAFARRAVETGNVDFDVTGQFAAETVQINLDANDPMAEADFHLAYGLYDEAILLLRQAAGRDPGRTELRVKLAETYFAAGRPAEFEETAEGLQGRADAATWQKIAIMGQQLCPDAQMFKGGDNAAMANDLDMAFDEPSTPEVPAARPPADDGLDFHLDELELPKADAGLDMPQMKHDDALEFDLGDFDLGASEPAKPVSAAAVPAREAGNGLEFDLGGFDLPEAVPPPAAPARPGIKADEVALDMDDLKLEDFDLGGDSDTISSGDETSTKLDLARAYVDMGDNEMARNLLTEVLLQGSDAQKVEAQKLLGRLT